MDITVHVQYPINVRLLRSATAPRPPGLEAGSLRADLQLRHLYIDHFHPTSPSPMYPAPWGITRDVNPFLPEVTYHRSTYEVENTLQGVQTFEICVKLDVATE